MTELWHVLTNCTKSNLICCCAESSSFFQLASKGCTAIELIRRLLLPCITKADQVAGKVISAGSAHGRSSELNNPAFVEVEPQDQLRMHEASNLSLVQMRLAQGFQKTEVCHKRLNPQWVPNWYFFTVS